MRFCPFCSAENADELAVCQSCGRRLPPLPPRRARNAPGTGVQLPPRAPTAGATQPLGSMPSVPPAATPTSGTAPVSAPASGTKTTAPGVGGTQVMGSLAPTPAPRPATSTRPPTSVPSVVPSVVPSIARPATTTQPPPRPAPTTTQPPPLARATTTATQPPLARPGTVTQPPSIAQPPSALIQPSLVQPSANASSVAPAPAPASPEPRTGAPTTPPLIGAAQPGVMVTSAVSSPASPAPPAPAATPIAAPVIAVAPVAAPVIAVAPVAAPVIAVAPVAAPIPPTPMPLGTEARALANAIWPAPAAQRREAPAPEPRDAGDPGRRRDDAALPTTYPRVSDEGATASPITIDALRSRDVEVEPPPTRIHRPEALVDRPFAPPQVSPIPVIPEPGLVHAARYTVRFVRARWQRRGAIKLLGADIKKDTDALDQVLGALGTAARAAKVDGRVFFGENAAINNAEDRVATIKREHADVDARKLDENSKFGDIERERNTKLGEAERMVDEAQKELAQLEAQRRAQRDKRKDLERRQKTFLKNAEDNDKQTASAEGEARNDLRRSAEQHRREAAALEPERQELERRLAAIERPISEGSARLDAAKAELDAAKRSLSDAREGHTHRLDELDAEQKRKAREIAAAEAEIARRLVTLGTLVNLNRPAVRGASASDGSSSVVDDPQFAELYHRIDRLRGAITARTTEIEKLTAEREAYDRGTVVRGLAVIGAGFVLFIAIIVILRAILG